MTENGAVTAVAIERVVPGGDGLGRIDGVIVLVPGGLPGDRLRIQVERDGPRLLRGTLLEVVAPGPARRESAAVCPRAADGSCGGCDWPAVELDRHRALKESLVTDALRRIGRLSPDAIPPFAWHGSPRNYRLRNRLHVDGLGRIGFYGPRSNDVSDLLTCEIVSEALLARLPSVRGALRSFGAPVEGELLTLEGREGAPLLGELRLERGVAGADELSRRLLGPLDGVRIVDPDGNLLASAGPDSLDLEASGATFRVSVPSFLQGNRYLLGAFLEETRAAVREAAAEGPVRRALDLYAGVGFLTRPLLETGADATAVEVDPSSSRDLAFNLERWRVEGLPRARVVPSTAEAFLRSRPGRFDVVVADPPRSGISSEVRKALLRLRPRRLVLVSCDPATLARDLRELVPPYRIGRIVLLDLFPGTHHVETLVTLGQ